MKLLDRYIIKEFSTIFLFILASIISVYLLIDFFGKIRMFMSNSATVGQMASHFFFMIPMIISQTTPAIVLLSTLLTFGTFSKHSEIVAMKANGVSLYRTALPIMAIGILICVFLFLFSEFANTSVLSKSKNRKPWALLSKIRSGIGVQRASIISNCSISKPTH